MRHFRIFKLLDFPIKYLEGLPLRTGIGYLHTTIKTIIPQEQFNPNEMFLFHFTRNCYICYCFHESSCYWIETRCKVLSQFLIPPFNLMFVTEQHIYRFNLDPSINNANVKEKTIIAYARYKSKLSSRSIFEYVQEKTRPYTVFTVSTTLINDYLQEECRNKNITLETVRPLIRYRVYEQEKIVLILKEYRDFEDKTTNPIIITDRNSVLYSRMYKNKIHYFTNNNIYLTLQTVKSLHNAFLLNLHLTYHQEIKSN